MKRGCLDPQRDAANPWVSGIPQWLLRKRVAPKTPARTSAAVTPEMIEAGSGTAAAEIMTVPAVLVKGTAEVSCPVSKLKLSKNVCVLVFIEPLPDGGTRLTV
jgi:hypothetical protein